MAAMLSVVNGELISGLARIYHQYGLREDQTQWYMDEVRPGTGREGDLGYKPGQG